jgi:hypothetical protein
MPLMLHIVLIIAALNGGCAVSSDKYKHHTEWATVTTAHVDATPAACKDGPAKVPVPNKGATDAADTARYTNRLLDHIAKESKKQQVCVPWARGQR